MQVVKALVGGVIGGGIGAFLSGQIQSMTDLSSPWLLLIIGLGTGLGARLACGANRSFATGVTGAVAAIVMIFGSSYMDAMAEAKGSAEANAEPVSVIDVNELSPAELSEGVEEATDPGDGGEAEESEADGEADSGDDTDPDDAETSDDAETDDAETDDAETDDAETSDDAETDSEKITTSDAGTGPSPTSNAPADATAPGAAVSMPSAWSPLDFLINGGSALLAFVLSSGSGAAAGGGASRSEDSDA